jgi:NADH-quinone oxidoreductase subunit C
MTDDMLAPLLAAAPGARVTSIGQPGGPADEVVTVARDEYAAAVTAARDAGFDVFIDLCAVDHLRRDPRFEVVVVLLSHDPPRRLRFHVGVPGSDPEVPSITPIFAGANFYEREAFDLFGVRFAGHPDLTRILLPDEWEGHPLRKDYAVGSVPVQFKEAHRAP